MTPNKLLSFLLCLISLFIISCVKENSPRIASTLEGVDYDGNTLLEVTFKDESRMYFKLNDNATAEVVRGSIFYTDSPEWSVWVYRGDIIIPEEIKHNGKTYKVTSIGDHAFYPKYSFNATSTSLISSITLPSTIDTIHENAFLSCEYLSSINNLQSVKFIGANAFNGCWNLRSITIPNTVAEIYPGTFHACAFDTLELPNTIIAIDDYAFGYCSNLTNFDIPASVQFFGMFVLDGCKNLKTITCHPPIPPRMVTQEYGVGDYIILSISDLNIEKVYVPTESVNLYKESPDWRYYKDIIVGF